MRPQHFIPAERGTVRQLHVLLENMKELALQAEFGARDEPDNMRTVRRFVADLWQESNRLNAREAQLLLSEMFYQVAQQPDS